VLARTDGLTTGYGGGEPAVEDVTFAVEAGERVAVLGPNGGGKSTLLRALLGELPAWRGHVELAARCAIVPQGDRGRLDYPVSALDVALMGTLARLPWWRRPGRAERDEARAALASVGLEDRATAAFGALSGGQRQRVLIARALVARAQLLLLDEPYAGLDAPAAAQLTDLIDALAGEGRGIVMTTHDLAQARRFDRVLLLSRRQTAFGPPADALSETALHATYGHGILVLGGHADAPEAHP